jgi:hypothetical protein
LLATSAAIQRHFLQAQVHDTATGPLAAESKQGG